MRDAELLRLSFADAAMLLREKQLSPVELTRAVLAHIERSNTRLNAFTTVVDTDAAIAQAQRAESELVRGECRGPFHGMPVSLKDLIDTAGLRTTYGSGMFRDYVPRKDGAIPERLRAQGAILTGKTATHELGQGISTNNHFFGPTLNPWSPAHVPGGSSGGAAAASAARLGPIHIGTDGGGSVRIPATFCGVVGHKPTLGLLSNRGQFGDGNTSFSVPGPLTRTVRDAALATQALAGWDAEYVFSRPGPVPDLLGDLAAGVRGLRLGTSPDAFTDHLHPEIRARYDATLRRLERLGAEIVEVRLPHQHLILRVVGLLFGIEGGAHLDALIGDRPRVFGPHVQRMQDMSSFADRDLWVAGLHDRQLVCRDYAAAFLEVDALVLPVSPLPAPRIDADESTYMFNFVPYTGAANLTGLPATAIPVGLVDGLPVGVQIMAPAGADALTLRIAHALEADDPIHRVQEPPLD